MKVYKLRCKVSGLFYAGKGYLSKDGKTYSSKGHIKNSVKQSGQYGRVIPQKDFEIVTYELTEEKTEAL